MNRALTLVAASACAALAVSSACFGADWSSLPFRLTKSSDAARLQFAIEEPNRGKRSSHWSQSLPPSALAGFDAARFAAPSSTSVRFALQRPAGRFDCMGSARSSDARGNCRFTADTGFAALLERRGIGRPTPEQSYKLAMSGVHADVFDALSAHNYPRPTIDESIALGIFGVDPTNIRELAAAGYRLGSVKRLIEFKIHRVSPAYISSFAALGYRDLTPAKLVQMRIFGVTPDDVRALQGRGVASPSADQLVAQRLGVPQPRPGR